MQMAAFMVTICVGLGYGLVPVFQVPVMHARGITL